VILFAAEISSKLPFPSVNLAPVNYTFRFSGPVTVLTARRVRYGVRSNLHMSAQSFTSIKTHSSPAAFLTTLSLSFLFPSPLPSSYPPSPHDAASGKNVAARRLTLIRSTPRQHCLVDRLTRASTPSNDADEAPGVPAGRRRRGHATASDTGLLLLPFKLRPPIHHTSSRLHRGRPRLRQHAGWLGRHYVVLLPISTAALLSNVCSSSATRR
jgi:hypothetical protein